jgi:HK97 family phage portal protein
MFVGDNPANVNQDTALRVGTVYACTRILAESVAILPLRLHRITGAGTTEEKTELAFNHSLDRLVRLKPSRMHTAFEWKRLAMTHLVLAGNFYCLVRRLGTEIKELLPFANPRAMEVTQDEATLEIKYRYQKPDGTFSDFRQGEIFHLRSLNTDGLVGLSVITAAAQAIGVALQAEKHGSKILRNGANVGGVLEHPQQLSGDAAKRLRESFDSLYAGAENAGKTILLEEGMKFSKVGMTADEAQFIESRKFQRSDIGMFFGVPPHMYGDVERGTSWGSGIEVQGVNFVTYTLLSWLTNITLGADCSLLTPTEQDNYQFRFDTEPLTRAEFYVRQQGNEIMARNKVLLPNEWRRREGMAPVAGGNEFPASAPAQAPVTGDKGNGSKGQDPAGGRQAA